MNPGYDAHFNFQRDFQWDDAAGRRDIPNKHRGLENIRNCPIVEIIHNNCHFTLAHFFEDVPMPRLKAHQFGFLSQALGGSKQYGGASMRDAHRRLAIEHCHYDAVATHLLETLRELKVPEAIVAEVGQAVTQLSSEIVNTAFAPVSAR